jgi:hypothetical protein
MMSASFLFFFASGKFINAALKKLKNHPIIIKICNVLIGLLTLAAFLLQVFVLPLAYWEIITGNKVSYELVEGFLFLCQFLNFPAYELWRRLEAKSPREEKD